MRRIFGNGRYANVTATMALVVALGGTSYAAVALPKNSVGSGQIKKGAVKGPDIKGNAVTTGKVKNGSLLAADFKTGQLPAGAKGNKGDTGPRGDTGPKGDTGLQGPAGTFGAVTVQFASAAADLADGANASYNVFCPAGQQAIGGGARGDATSSEATSVTSSRPAKSAIDTEPPTNGQSFTGWRITVVNPAGGVTTGIRPEVWAICVPAIAPAP